MLDNLLNGSIAGGIGAFCVLPIDITKTHIQSSTTKQNPIYIIKQIYKIRGINGFYAGGISQILFVAPEKAIKFSINDFVLTLTDNKIFAGMCGGLSQVIITNPMEILKIQSQMNNKTNSYLNKFTIIDAYKQIGSIKGLYKGVVICAMRDIPFSGIYFPLYNLLSTKFTNTYVSSLVAGGIAAFICTPMDVIKTRLQYKLSISYGEIIKELVKKEGFRGFYKGCIWRSLKSGPQFMITQSVYNFLNHVY
jgi:solute carrier family 25 aspartate/glutamate transporter 12/13